MKPVGIIANAHSGKDIRRLVSSATVIDDREKANIIGRLLLSLDAMGVEQVLIMPDPVGLARMALRDVGGRLTRLQASILKLPDMAADYRDSLQAARTMAEADCACIVTLGGDGTNRVVAGACGDTPLLPISAGTNNVFPYFVEATIAGMAAAAFARGIGGPETCRRQPRLELYVNDDYLDMALVDVVVVAQHHTGARAVWDPASFRELFLARARPGDIGLSSIGAAVCPLSAAAGQGLYLRTGHDGMRVLAPIAPGLIEAVDISEHRRFSPGEKLVIASDAGVIALDGERETVIEQDCRYSVMLEPHGPAVIDIGATLAAAVEAGLLIQSRPR